MAIYPPLTGGGGGDGTPVPGPPGPTGPDGKSAYEVAKDSGFSGTEAEWLESLQGDPGEPGEDGDPGTSGTDGDDGKSAYEIYVGTVDPNDTPMSEAEWLASLKGDPGEDGEDGDDATVDPAADYAWTGDHSGTRGAQHTDDWVIYGPTQENPSGTSDKLLYVHRNSLGGEGDAVNYKGKSNGEYNLINRKDLTTALENLDTGGGGGSGSLPPRFFSDFVYKDNAVEYPKSFDMRAGGSAATGPHHTVTEVNLRIAHADPFWEACESLYNKSSNCPLLWRDKDGRTTHYLVRSGAVTRYGDYDKYTFAVVYDPPPEGDWGTNTSWVWADYTGPFPIEIEFPDDVITRELLAADHEYFAKHGFEFTDNNAFITFDGGHSKGDNYLKFRETWNGTSYAYLRDHPSTNGCIAFDFVGSGSSTFAFHWDQTGDVVVIDRYGMKVNGSAVTRNVDLLESVRVAKSFEDFKQALIAKLEERTDQEEQEVEDE